MSTIAKNDTGKPQGHYRTTETDWERVAPYIRYRYERAQGRLPLHGTVYELGAGIGVGTAFLARMRPDLNFIGFEMSKEAVDYGMGAFKGISNFKLVQASDILEVSAFLEQAAFLVALEVLEHLNDLQLDQFKSLVMPKLQECVFSFPYQQTEREGTDHLQCFDMWNIFEIFPGFETIFVRRGSIKFIGYWERKRRGYLLQPLGIGGEAAAMSRLSPCL
ncbi:MAG: hypothetical protein AB7U43_03060 [Desulfobacter sp.]